MTVQESLDGFPQIRDDVESVSNLLGEGRATRRSLDVAVAAVTTNDLHARVRPQPFCERIGGAIRQEINGLLLLQIDDDRAVPLTLSPGPIIYANDPRRRGIARTHSMYLAKHRVWTCWNAQTFRKPCTCLATASQRDAAQNIINPSRAPAVGKSKLFQSLSEDAPFTRSLNAEETPCVPADRDMHTRDRKVGK